MLILDREHQNCTCCGDVVRLLEVKGETRRFSLYKTWKVDLKNFHQQGTYFILAEDDPFPIIITKKMADEILKNPEEGVTLVADYWLGRYR